MFNRFKKKDEEEYGVEMVQEKPQATLEPEHQPESESTAEESIIEQEPKNETRSIETQTTTSASSNIGIDALMNKRVNLEGAIDYVGVMIKDLKDKRTNLEKEIEEESVDIKNLKEKLVKIREYIDEENLGIENLTRRRSQVEQEADGVGNIISDLKSKLSGIDGIIDAEGKKVQSFKESRHKSD